MAKELTVNGRWGQRVTLIIDEGLLPNTNTTDYIGKDGSVTFYVPNYAMIDVYVDGELVSSAIQASSL